MFLNLLIDVTYKSLGNTLLNTFANEKVEVFILVKLF